MLHLYLIDFLLEYFQTWYSNYNVFFLVYMQYMVFYVPHMAQIIIGNNISFKIQTKIGISICSVQFFFKK